MCICRIFIKQSWILNLHFAIIFISSNPALCKKATRKSYVRYERRDLGTKPQTKQQAASTFHEVIDYHRQSITALWSIPTYTAGYNSTCPNRKSNRQPLSCKSNALRVEPPLQLHSKSWPVLPLTCANFQQHASLIDNDVVWHGWQKKWSP